MESQTCDRFITYLRVRQDLDSFQEGFKAKINQRFRIRFFLIHKVPLVKLLMFIFLQRSISFDLWVDMVWHGDLHSRSYSILSFTYHASSHTAIALLLFMALTLISVAVALSSYIGNNERNAPLKGEDFRR